MSNKLNNVLRNKAINGWPLFWLISVPMSTVMVFASLQADLTTGEGVSTMIGFSVRIAVPIIFLVIAISSLQKLFPGAFSNWLLRNRKHIGMCFAVAMGWQGLFIATMSLFFREYYYEDIYLLRDELEGSIGYIFLTAMVLTSFNFSRKHLSPKQWKLIHKSAIYFIFAYPFSVYWWNLSYYPNPQPMDYVYYWMGFLAFSLRILAWSKKRSELASRASPARSTPLALQILGGVVVGLGLVYSVASLYSQDAITGFLTVPIWSADLVLWLPYWPLEPYLSLFLMAIGALLATKARAVNEQLG